MNAIQKNNVKNLKVSKLIVLAHIPIFAAIAYYFKTEMILAIGVPILVTVIQYLSVKIFKESELPAMIFAFNMMVLSGIMIHLGKGMIEFHFHIFVTIGCLSLFANPWVVLTAAATIAVHHIGLFFVLPSSLLNYTAGFGTIVIHALFVVVEAIACMYLAHKFRNAILVNEKVSDELRPLVDSLKESSSNSQGTCTSLEDAVNSNSSATTQMSQTSVEISKQVEHNVGRIENSVQIMDVSLRSVNECKKHLDTMKEIFSAIGKMKSDMHSLNTSSHGQLKSLVSSFERIQEKIDFITDIVFQTKLLSFNASVEAARAGESGKGFAVVAEEIGNLASNSGGASDVIQQIIDENKIELDKCVADITGNLTSFETQFGNTYEKWDQISEQLFGSFDIIINKINEQSSIVNEISTASSEQSQGVQELTEAITQIATSLDGSVTDIKSLMENIEGLKDESDTLDNICEDLLKAS